MAVGTSGRIVIDIDPRLKRRLHAALAQDGKSLKEWFLDRCARYLAERGQHELFDERGEERRGGVEERR